MISVYYAIAAGMTVLIISTIIMLKKKVAYKKILAAAIFNIYITGIVSLTFFPIDFTHKVDSNFNIFDNKLLLIPFHTMITDLTMGHYFNLIVHSGGNLLMTVPLGILLPIVFKVKHKISYFIVFFLFTLTIETGQLLIGCFLNTWYRTADIDDIILNFSGAVIGYIIFLITHKIITKMKKAQSIQDTSSE